jgi:hypothetical protein
MSHELERRGHENAILCHGTLQSLNMVRELQVTYHRLSEAEHGWTYTCQHLDLTRKEVDICTHVIIHLETPMSSRASSSWRGQ